jgi:Holliday junction resolvase-like predicted endonuclease
MQQQGKKLVVFVELKSRRGVASKAQKQTRDEMLPAGAEWWMVRSARAAMTALRRAGVQWRERHKRAREAEKLAATDAA